MIRARMVRIWVWVWLNLYPKSNVIFPQFGSANEREFHQRLDRD